MEERCYSSLSRHGLASNYSYLDGVPFKISSNFRQPLQVLPLSEVIKPDIHHASSLDYDFETEEGVLRWAKARTEAAKQQAVLQGQKEESAATVSSQAEDNCNPNGSRETATSQSYGQVNAPPKPSVLPKPTHTVKIPTGTGTILKPIPIHPTAVKKSDMSDSQNSFDVSMFESEADPFDNLELQTINDLEELKVVLDSSSRNSNPDSGVSVQSEGFAHSSNSSTANRPEEILDSFYDVATAIPEQVDITFDKRPVSNEAEPGNFIPATNNSDELRRSPTTHQDGDYMEIKDSVAENSSVNGDLKCSSPTSWETSYPVSKLPPSKVNTKLMKFVLPPIPSSLDGSKPTNEQTEQSGDPFIKITANSNLTVLENCTNVVDLTKPTKLSNVPPPVAVKPHLSGTRMWSSVGPLSVPLFDDSSSRCQLSTSDFDISKSHSEVNHKLQVLNPLPSIQQSNTSKPWNKHCNETHAVVTSEPLGLTDPYHSLSSDDQQFVDNLTSMGFRRARVARAVSNFGRDEREVLDHLLAVDSLVDKKYAPVFVETALITYKNDVKKAEKFLAMLSSFKELGFSGEKIKDALIATDLDHDKSLDLLTA